MRAWNSSSVVFPARTRPLLDFIFLFGLSMSHNFYHTLRTLFFSHKHNVLIGFHVSFQKVHRHHNLELFLEFPQPGLVWVFSCCLLASFNVSLRLQAKLRIDIFNSIEEFPYLNE